MIQAILDEANPDAINFLCMHRVKGAISINLMDFFGITNINKIKLNTIFKWHPGKYGNYYSKKKKYDQSKKFYNRALSLFNYGYELGYILQNIANHFHFLKSRLAKLKHEILDVYLHKWINENNTQT